MMVTFWEWLSQGNEFGYLQELQRLFREGDEGYQSFLDQTNAMFRQVIGAILRMGKFSDPRNEAEAQKIVTDPTFFNYAQELVDAATGGRARLRGQDALDGAQDANMQLWMNLLSPRLYEQEGVTWESRNPFSAGRNGVRGTIRSWARNKAGHFATRLLKRRTGVTTVPISQFQDAPFDPEARPHESDVEWEDLRQTIIDDLEAQLRKEVEAEGPHWKSRVRNLRLAVEVVKRQMAIPWTWRSMPEIADEMGLQTALRGGLADQLKRLIDQTKRRVLGEAKHREQPSLIHNVSLMPEDGRAWPVNFGRANACDTG
jgi:hypothetical protein